MLDWFQRLLPREHKFFPLFERHVSRKRAYFVDNWNVFVEEMRKHPPHLIVHSGDVSFDGAEDEDDLAFARSEKDRLPTAWIAIPGNHDIGESPLAIRLQQPINAERMDRWQRHYGPSRWCRDLGEWRLIGIDTALLGSGHAGQDAAVRVSGEATRVVTIACYILGTQISGTTVACTWIEPQR